MLMTQSHLTAFLDSNALLATILNGRETRKTDDFYNIVNEIMCESTKKYTECRRLAEAKSDMFDYFNCKLAESAIDHGLNYYPATYESVGSKGEGLGFLANDNDLLCVSRKLFVCLPSTTFEPDINTFILDQTNCHAGYCKLKFHRGNKCDSFSFPQKDIVRKDREVYIKGTAVVRWFQNGNVSFNDWVWHGPALTSENSNQDWVLAFQCLNSEDLYKQYLKRKRCWPDSTAVEKLTRIPCSVVCAQHPHSIESDLDFRFSYATAEKFLVRSLSHIQLACYYLLKVVKSRVEDICEGQNTLRTYYVKTAFLWLCEKLHPNVWTDDNFLNCAFLNLSYLLFCYNTHELPQLFIPENNLIDHLTTSECEEVQGILKRFVDPINPRSVLDCFCDDAFDGFLDEVFSRPRRDIRQKIRLMFSKISTTSFDIDHISPLMEADTISYVLGELAVRDEHVFCQTLHDTIQNLESIVTSDIGECLKPMLYRLLGDLFHRYPRVIRAHVKLAEECYNKGIEVAYPVSGFDDKGLSGSTQLALFHYLNGDNNKAFKILSDLENIICEMDPIFTLSILLVCDDISRTWRDMFLSDLIKSTTDKYSIALPIKCGTLAIYLICRCALSLRNTHNITIQKCRTKKLSQILGRNEETLSSVIKDDEVLYATLKVSHVTKTLLKELMNT